MHSVSAVHAQYGHIFFTVKMIPHRKLTSPLLAIAVVAAQHIAAAPLHAQTQVKPLNASATVLGVSAISPTTPALTQTSQQGNPCNPGACFIGSINVQSNQKWQAQVRIKPSAPTNFIANWVLPNNQHQSLSSANWLTISSSTSATAGTSIALKFNANKATGKGGQTPTAAQLSTYLEYRVIALP